MYFINVLQQFYIQEYVLCYALKHISQIHLLCLTKSSSEKFSKLLYQIFLISKLMQNWRHFSEAFHWSQILKLWRVLKRVLLCPLYLIVYHILSDFFNESLWLTAPLCLIFYFIHVCMMSKIWSTCLHPVEISFGNMSILNGWNVWRIIFLCIYFTYSVAFVEKSFICNHLFKISGGDLRLEGFYSTSIKSLNFVKMNPHISIFPCHIFAPFWSDVSDLLACQWVINIEEVGISWIKKFATCNTCTNSA